MVFSRFTKPDDADIERRIRDALHEVSHVLRSESLVVELVEYVAADRVALLRFSGDCPECEGCASMYLQGVEAHLRMQVPEVLEVRERVESVNEHVSRDVRS